MNASPSMQQSQTGMPAVQYLLTKAPVLVVGILLAFALLLDGLHPVIGPILLLFDPCPLILQHTHPFMHAQGFLA
jgi:hypothetical protein